MHLDIITPDEQVFSGEISEITVPGLLGSFQVLNNHAPLVSALAAGSIVFKGQSGEVTLTSEGGVIEVLNNKIILLAEKITRKAGN